MIGHSPNEINVEVEREKEAEVTNPKVGEETVVDDELGESMMPRGSLSGGEGSDPGRREPLIPPGEVVLLKGDERPDRKYRPRPGEVYSRHNTIRRSLKKPMHAKISTALWVPC